MAIWDNPEATYRETLGPAMEITDQLEADEYLARLMHRAITLFGHTPEKAYANEMINLGYYAGYYDRETAVRVQVLFKASHPIIPTGATSEEIIAMGKAMATNDKTTP